ncbi:MAG TPA: hypothetical protein DGH68_12610, partial [Bacteroidetes bacterium]|nr:hypothetical protein [Bacteroidota bacterium]
TTSPDSVHLTGSGVQAAFSGSPNPLTFGNVSVGASASDTITVANTGTATLVIDSVRIVSGEYLVTPSGSRTIGAGSNAKFAVVFSPTSIGTQNGGVVFFDNAPSSPHSVSVSGTGVSSTLSVNFSLSGGWDMVSLPVRNPTPGNAPLQIFPTGIASGYVWGWNGSSYAQVYSLANMQGYWNKFPATPNPHPESATGTRDILDTLAIGTGGWRMIGTLSDPIPISAVTSVPPGLLNGAIWWGWNGSSYQQTTTLSLGHGYWVKVGTTTSGILIFTNASPLAPSKPEAGGKEVSELLNSVTITDSRGVSQTLYFGADAKNEIAVEKYAMPPLPPVGAFDARFETVEGGSLAQTHAVRMKEELEFPVKIQSDAYPLTVSWKINKGTSSYELTDGLGSRVFRPREMSNTGSMQIMNSGLNKFTIRLV